MEKSEKHQSSDIVYDLGCENVEEILEVDLPSDKDEIEQSSNNGNELIFNE